MSFTLTPALIVSAPVVLSDANVPVVLSQVPFRTYVMLKFQNHWCALTCTITSGFCGIVSVVTSVVNAATPTTTRMIAGMTVHNASRRGLFVAGVRGATGGTGGNQNFGTPYERRAIHTTASQNA